MKLHIAALVILTGLSCSGLFAQSVLPDSVYVHITTNGHYTMLANANNVYEQGETVDITSEYYIGKYAVTCQEWYDFITATDKNAPGYWVNGMIPYGKNKHPVVWVSYGDAQEYCNWLEQQYPLYNFRLPTHAEWEFAASGNKRSIYPWGDELEVTYENLELASKLNYNAVFGANLLHNPDRIATFNNPKSPFYNTKEIVGNIITVTPFGNVTGWINHQNYTGLVYTDIFSEVNNSGGFTCPVDDYSDGVSPWGCYNMSGNCWEWTSTEEIASNGAEKGQLTNTVKGGSWYATAKSCRVSFRGEGRKPNGCYATVGFRVVAIPKQPESVEFFNNSDNIDEGYYTLTGNKISYPSVSGIYIKVQRMKPHKILIK